MKDKIELHWTCVENPESSTDVVMIIILEFYTAAMET